MSEVNVSLLKFALPSPANSEINRDTGSPCSISASRSYGHPMLIAKANYRALANLPPVNASDLRSLEGLIGRLNDAICGLMKSGHSKEVDSVMSMETALAKLPACLKAEWDDQIKNMRHDPKLTHLRNWLYRRIMGRKIASAGEGPPQPDRKREGQH